ncbi:NEDD8-activating enzyme E1 catalytic subunit [Nosema granulosis]|uniref:NEDD8-activating enzyme E1 catalytic subunit n=1 Tax=Nosema granulosis TaxID=83296 RepID=A0A9P6H1C8_9MICR|nr:NEDD8-activating enzyme E1 catalytic subunit [Nosema granulosis]
MVNLNRLFPFKESDIGRFKSQAASSIFGCEYSTKDLLSFDTCEISKFDCIILAVDNVETRMHLNLLFKQSTCRYLLDCGVVGDSAHALITDKNNFCLYCIKELYDTSQNLNLCTLKYLHKHINKENRFEMLKSYVGYYRNLGLEPREIVQKFNQKSSLPATFEEVKHLFENIIPSICYVNSICASFVVSLLENKIDGNFILYNGNQGISIQSLRLERDPSCFLCKF